MDLTSAGLPPDTLVGILVTLVMLVGLVGIVLPVLPGLALICAATLGWALWDSSVLGWLVLAVALVLWAAAFVLQYYVPGKRLQAAGVPNWVLAVSALAGVMGFFVVPVVGLPLFFVGGVYLLQSARAGHLGRSMGSTWQAILAVGLSMLIELTAGMLIIVTWGASLVVSGLLA